MTTLAALASQVCELSATYVAKRALTVDSLMLWPERDDI
jgi:hypothetical protein